MKINVHIERLILEGLPVTTLQAPLVQGDLEKQLAHLLAGNGLSEELRGGLAVPRVRAGTLQFAVDNQPAGLGRDIARAIYEGIGQPTERVEGVGEGPSRMRPAQNPEVNDEQAKRCPDEAGKRPRIYARPQQPV